MSENNDLYRIKLKEIELKNFGEVEKEETIDINLMYTIIYPKEGIAKAQTEKIKEAVRVGKNPIILPSQNDIEVLKKLKSELKDSVTETQVKKFREKVGEKIFKEFAKVAELREKESEESSEKDSKTDKSKPIKPDDFKSKERVKELSELIDFSELEKILKLIDTDSDPDEIDDQMKKMLNKAEVDWMKRLIDLKLLELRQLPIKELLYQPYIKDNAYLDLLLEQVEKKDDKKKKDKDIIEELIPGFLSLVPGMNFVISYFYELISKTILSTKSKDIRPSKGFIKINKGELERISKTKSKVMEVPLYVMSDLKSRKFFAGRIGGHINDHNIYSGYNTLSNTGEKYGKVFYEVIKETNS